MATDVNDLQVVIRAAPEVLTTGTAWYGSADVTGMFDGERFSASFDFSHASFPTQADAERYARERVQERIATGLIDVHARPAEVQGRR